MDQRESLLSTVEPLQANEERKNNALHIYRMIRLFSRACDDGRLKEIRRLQSAHQELLKDFSPESLNSELITSPDFKYSEINKILSENCEKFKEDKNELLFFASAKFDPDLLQEAIDGLKQNSSNYQESIDQTRFSDSAIIFALKYGDIRNEQFFNCMEILIKSQINVNKFDIEGKTAIDYVAILYKEYKDEKRISQNLKILAMMLFNTKIYEPEKSTKDILINEMKLSIDSNYNYLSMDEKSKLFYWIIKNSNEEFLNFKNIKNYVNCDNGENTLLQFAIITKRCPIVKYLLENKANPNLCTKQNTFTPLELAGRNNIELIFQEILKCDQLKLTQKQFSNFVKWKDSPMKGKLFEVFLESKKIDPTWKYESTGNTPLHYAIIFSHKKAIQNLLKLGSSLITKNKAEKCCLDIIDPVDLETYFHSCLVLDNYKSYFTDLNYKMKFRFGCLITEERELKVISKIGNSSNLKHLLKHTFIHIFINLKWYKTQFYFWLILLIQALLFLVMGILFYRYPVASAGEITFCAIFAILNMILKLPLFLNFNIKNKQPIFYAFNKITLHFFIEIFLMIVIFGSFFQDQFRAFLFTLMAVAFLLTAGYHPKISKWSLMLQTVFKSFAILLIFFSLIVLGFSLGFHILFEDGNHALFSQFFSSLFRTYIMTTGEFDINAMNFDNARFAGYLLFFLFAMTMSLVLVNFWTGVAVTDIERIENHSEINAFKNVIIFIEFIENIYSLKHSQNVNILLRVYAFIFKKIASFSNNVAIKILKYNIPKPFLFLNFSDDKIYRNQKYEVDFYVNKSPQFKENIGFPPRIDDDCLDKIKLYFQEKMKTTEKAKLWSKLEEITKALNQMKSEIQQIQTEGRTSSNKKWKNAKKGK